MVRFQDGPKVELGLVYWAVEAQEWETQQPQSVRVL